MKRERFDDQPPKEKESYFARPKTDMDFIASGCKVFDLALGGGWAERRIANVVGDKSTGKTLLAIEASANFASKYPKGRTRLPRDRVGISKGLCRSARHADQPGKFR
jgi:RecA/RadA recombinase